MRRRPPRSTPFPYTTLFRSSKRRTQASDCAAAESGQSGEGAARRWTASRVPAAGGVSPIGQNKWKAQEGTRPRQPRRSRQLARHRDRKFQLYRDRKSVVSGKSVDLGGRRIIKKKKRRLKQFN